LKLSKESSCHKEAKDAGKFGAGTILYWCAEHRCCLGFTVLQSAESVRQVFEAITVRFKEMPKVIIYDNGCNLHEYILNRAPELYDETLILCDGFHFRHHKNCCTQYNSREYRFLDGKYYLK
jgi:hypothetical protein